MYYTSWLFRPQIAFPVVRVFFGEEKGRAFLAIGQHYLHSCPTCWRSTKQPKREMHIVRECDVRVCKAL